MFRAVPNTVDFVAQEHEILRLWKDLRAFDALRRLRANAPRWSFLDGPITANNPMGVHHGWGRTYKDLFHRFEAMRGRRARYQNGFDCQGLWVEVNVEKDMGFETKRDIEAFGLDRFVILCKQRVLNYAAVQTEQSIRLGYWMDWDDPAVLRRLSELLGEDPARSIAIDTPQGHLEGSVESVVGRLGEPGAGGSYFTFSDRNNYTIWAALKSCHERGWIYKGRDVMPWCPRCGTGLSQHEIVTEGYQELTHPSVLLRFPLRERPGESLLVWTTTPWTLTSNMAAAVGPDLEYARVRQDNEVLYLARKTLGQLRGPHRVEGTLRGAEMLGWTYAGPFDELPAAMAAAAPSAHRVIPWQEVGEAEGTGIVHIAPGCGAEDFALSKELGLPVVAPLNELGYFVEGFGDLTGRHVKEANEPIFEALQEKGLIYRIEDYTHRYPVCWRCSEPLVFRLVDEWFISMGQALDKPFDQVTTEEKEASLRYQIMEVVLRETRWHPEFGLERELDWLRNMHDWMISKKRYWGLALPIYECRACGDFDVIGSREELRERAVSGWEVFEGHSPHRPHIDAVKVRCQKCGASVERIPDVGNPWLDAGVVGMSTLGYPDHTQLWTEWFPADLISESFPGQFRNWFYSLLTMSTILERRAPFRDVFSYATLLAEDGRAMHKSWGNAIEFNEAADRMGVDVMRWMYCGQRPEKDLLFGYHHADDVRRRFLLPLWNVYVFLTTYARIDGWLPTAPAAGRRAALDRWILARRNQLVEEVTVQLQAYAPHLATAAISRFVDDLSNWYLRRSRRRFWARAGTSQAGDEDKQAAYATLYAVLTDLCRLLAPFTPFVTEAIYQNLVRSVVPGAPESIHHLEWPLAESEWDEPDLLEEMEVVKRLVTLGHAARNASGRKVRQPLSEAVFAVPGAREKEILREYGWLVADELNVKSVRALDHASEVVDFNLKPLPRQLGQKHAARFPTIRDAIQALPAAPAAQTLLAGSALSVEIDGSIVEILPDEVEVQVTAHAGLAAVADGGWVAALRTEVTPELAAEGLAREFVRRAQDLRRKAELQVDQRARFAYAASPRLAEAIRAHRTLIAAEVLAADLQEVDSPEGAVSMQDEFDGERLTLAVTGASRPEQAGKRGRPG